MVRANGALREIGTTGLPGAILSAIGVFLILAADTRLAWGRAVLVGIGGLFVVFGVLSLSDARRRFVRHLRRKANLCVKCGYSLKALPEPRCPECGQPFEPKGDAP